MPPDALVPESTETHCTEPLSSVSAGDFASPVAPSRLGPAATFTKVSQGPLWKRDISHSYPAIEDGGLTRDYADRYWITEALSRSGTSASSRCLQHTLTRSDIEAMVERSGGCCEVTGLPFCFGKWGDSSRNPAAPSIDRIDSSKGYTPDNCRLVLAFVNLAISDWGDRIFDIAAVAYVAKKYKAKELDGKISQRTMDKVYRRIAQLRLTTAATAEAR